MRSEQHPQGRTACSQALRGLKERTGKAEGFLCIARASPQSSRRTGSSLLPPMSSTLCQGGCLKAAAAPRAEMGVWGGNATPRGAA